MGRFDHYFLMDEKDILEYIQYKYDFFPKDSILDCKEIGDGNLNYVFRVTEKCTGKSVILKHSGVETRAHSGRMVDVDRNRIEAEILQMQEQLCPGSVPHIYGYDATMCCCAMEDLKQYTIMRTALLNYRTFPLFSDHITSFLADILVPTSDIAMDHKQKKRLNKKYINPDLCSITEQLVYDEAVGNFSEKNSVSESLQDFVNREIYGDMTLRLEAAKLKFDFMEHAQSLLHGDLHSGSIFVTEDSTKIFDPEFAFYGPAGYDVGNVVAHLLFSYAHAAAELSEEDSRRKPFLDWCITTIGQVITLFSSKFTAKFQQTVTDALAKTPGFSEYYLSGILADTAATAGMELIRRIVGVAKVKDITCISDPKKSDDMQKKLLILAKKLILERNTLQTDAQWIQLIQEIL